MAVELRCPECKSKLRLQDEPDEDAEIECPKCDHVFTAGDVKSGKAASAADEEKPKKKKKKPAAEPEKPKKTEKAPEKKPADAGAPPKKRKKKKGKKRSTPPAVLAGIIVVAVMIIGTIVGVLVWFFTKKSASQEMMSYLPDDSDQVFGLNIGHLQKYPGFYKACEGTFNTAGFLKAGEQFATANGGDFNGTFDYVVYGEGRVGGKEGGQILETTVLKTKVEFDPGVLAKIPGAKEGSLNGAKYYAIPDIPELGYPNLRVFAPTNRLVVFCRGDIPEAKFRAMLGGNKENPDATFFVRAGALAKFTIRGTVWRITMYDRGFPRPAPPVLAKTGPGGGAAQPSDEDNLNKEIADLAAPAKAAAYKASVGSREVRGEWTLWYKDATAASDAVKKWKEKDWIKNSDEKDPPRWWQSLAQKSGGGKTAPNVLKDNLSFRSTGELFIIRSALDTNTLKTGVGGLVNAFVTKPPSSNPPGGGAPPPLPGGGPAPPPPKQRRRHLARR